MLFPKYLFCLTGQMGKSTFLIFRRGFAPCSCPCVCVFDQVQSIENKLDVLLNFYSQCLKKGSSNFMLSTLLDPDLTSDYHSPTDQRDLFPSANTLNISLSESGNLEWPVSRAAKKNQNFDTMSSCGPSSPSSTSALNSVFSLPGLIFFFLPLHLKSAPSPPPPGGSNLTRSLSQSHSPHMLLCPPGEKRGHDLTTEPPHTTKKKSMLTVESLTSSFWGFFLSVCGETFSSSSFLYFPLAAWTRRPTSLLTRLTLMMLQTQCHVFSTFRMMP